MLTLERIKTWHIFLIAVLFSEIFTLVLNSLQSIFRRGMISRELIEIGAIDAIFVSLAVAAMIVPLLRYSTKTILERKKVQNEITELKRAEEALRQSHERLRRFVDANIVGVIIATPSGGVIEANDYYLKVIGYTREEFEQGRVNWRAITPPEWLPADERAIAELRERGTCTPYEKEYVRRDGTRVSVFLSDSILPDTEEQIVAFVLDITERKKAERELKENEEKFRNLFNNAEVGMFRSRLDGSEVLDVNQKFLDIIGRTREETEGKPSLILWGDPKEREEMFQKLVAEGRVSALEIKMLNKHGGVRNCVTSLVLYREEGILEGSIMDITERKRAEEAVIHAKEEWERTFDSVPDLIALIDNEHRVLRVNRAMAEKFGITPQQFVGRHCYEVVHATSSPPDFCPHSRLLVSGKEERGEFMDNYLGGLFEVRTTPVYDKAGQLTGSVHIVRDITEHRKLEAQLRHAQKMEAVGQLAGGVAHDFNNILSAIIGYGHVMLMKMAQDEPQRLNVQQILDAADRAAHLTKDLLLFSRKQISDRRPVDLNEIIGTVEGFLGRVIGEDIAFETILHDGPILVLADMHQLEQVLMNLATNARDAMPKGGILTIATEQIMLDKEFIAIHGYGKLGMYAMITVADTGVGMDEHTQKRIFEPFFTTKEVGKGTGLGMAVVYGIIKEHDGYINVYSELGKGSTFRIYLPVIATEIIEEKKEAKVDYPERGTETILLAEDDESLRELTVSVLQEFGYKVIVAVDGEDAVKKYIENEDRIQLLLFDIVMPKKTGKEAYDEIKRIKSDIRVIFLSGYAPDIIRQKALLENKEPVAYKPISPTDLLKKIRSVLN